MPELPEVEYTRRQLQRAMAGARIERALARRADLRYPFPPDFASRLEGQTVSAVRRRAKYLVVELSSGDLLVMHLGMSGSFRVLRGAREEKQGACMMHGRSRLETHDHVVFEMSSGATVIFNDPRRFGFMKLATNEEAAADPAIGGLGPEPLDRAFTPAVLARALKGKKVSLKAALLDQRVVAGLGNIYASEALHRAGLSPKRKASTLATLTGAPRPQTIALVDAIRVTLKDAIANSHRMHGEDRFRVYDHEGERCRRHGCRGTIKRITQGGRSTFFCPVCQR